VGIVFATADYLPDDLENVLAALMSWCRHWNECKKQR